MTICWYGWTTKSLEPKAGRTLKFWDCLKAYDQAVIHAAQHIFKCEGTTKLVICGYDSILAKSLIYPKVKCGELMGRLYENETWVAKIHMQLWKYDVMRMHLFMKDKMLLTSMLIYESFSRSKIWKFCPFQWEWDNVIND